MFGCNLILLFFGVQLISFSVHVNGANILACLTSASRSHHIVEATILEELANRGHNVTVWSTFEKPEKMLPNNYHHIYIPMEDVDEWTTLRKGLLNNESKKADDQLKSMPKMIKLIDRRSSKLMKHEIVQNTMKSGQKFDLFFLGYNINDMMLGIAGHFRIPSVLVCLMPPLKGLRDMIGNPTAAASTPVFREPNSQQTYGFRMRLSNFIGYSVEFMLALWMNYFIHEPSYEEHFPAAENYPTLDEVRKNVSLIMTNSHFSEGTIRPALPNLIEIGGVHIKEKPNPLPKDIQNILDSANEHGVIVFSFGGNIKSSFMTAEKAQMFFNVFSKLEQKIIWKWESNEIPANKPENVHMLKWLPQSDLLAQPQVRFFISHCGSGGVFEAKYHGVPILGMPVYGDQPANANQIEGQGWAIILNFDHVNETILNDSIQQLLTNSTYKKAVKRLSQLFRDRPMTPLQTAVYWIEYVIRYDGAKHMQSPAVDLNIYQKSSFDVILFLVVILLVVIWLLVKTIKIIFRYRPLLIIFLSILIYYIVRLMRSGDENEK